MVKKKKKFKKHCNRHRHTWENKVIKTADGNIIIKYLYCTSCKKISVPDTKPRKTKGAFGGKN